MLEELFFSEEATKVIEYFILHNNCQIYEGELRDKFNLSQSKINVILTKLININFLEKNNSLGFYVLKNSEYIIPLKLLVKELEEINKR